MKNKFSVLFAGILALALVFGFGLLGCDTDGDDEEGGGPNVPAAKAHLTITGLSDWNGDYAIYEGNSSGNEITGIADIIALDSDSVTYKGVKIAGGEVKIPLYEKTFWVDAGVGKYFQAYTGDLWGVGGSFFVFLSEEVTKSGEDYNPDSKLSESIPNTVHLDENGNGTYEYHRSE